MGGRLGQFDFDYASDFGGDMIIPEWDVPVYDLPDFASYDAPLDLGFDPSANFDYSIDPTLDAGGIAMDPWIDPVSGETWLFDDASEQWYSADTGAVWSEPVILTPPSDMDVFTDEGGTTWFVDQNGTVLGTQDTAGNLTYYDANGNIVSQTDSAGSVISTTDPSTGYTTPAVAPPQPVMTSPTTGGGMSFPSLKDVGTFLQQAGAAYKTFTGGTTAPAPRPTTGGQVPTRINPTTGRTEYYNAQTRTWSTTRPASYPTTTRPPGAPAPQWIAGVSNQTLMIGAGVVGLAFLLAQRRTRR